MEKGRPRAGATAPSRPRQPAMSSHRTRQSPRQGKEGGCDVHRHGCCRFQRVTFLVLAMVWALPTVFDEALSAGPGQGTSKSNGGDGGTSLRRNWANATLSALSRRRRSEERVEGHDGERKTTEQQQQRQQPKEPPSEERNGGMLSIVRNKRRLSDNSEEQTGGGERRKFFRVLSREKSQVDGAASQKAASRLVRPSAPNEGKGVILVVNPTGPHPAAAVPGQIVRLTGATTHHPFFYLACGMKAIENRKDMGACLVKAKELLPPRDPGTELFVIVQTSHRDAMSYLNLFESTPTGSVPRLYGLAINCMQKTAADAKGDECRGDVQTIIDPGRFLSYPSAKIYSLNIYQKGVLAFRCFDPTAVILKLDEKTRVLDKNGSVVKVPGEHAALLRGRNALYVVPRYLKLGKLSEELEPGAINALEELNISGDWNWSSTGWIEDETRIYVSAKDKAKLQLERKREKGNFVGATRIEGQQFKLKTPHPTYLSVPCNGENRIFTANDTEISLEHRNVRSPFQSKPVSLKPYTTIVELLNSSKAKSYVTNSRQGLSQISKIVCHEQGECASRFGNWRIRDSHVHDVYVVSKTLLDMQKLTGEIFEKQKLKEKDLTQTFKFLLVRREPDPNATDYHNAKDEEEVATSSVAFFNSFGSFRGSFVKVEGKICFDVLFVRYSTAFFESQFDTMAATKSAGKMDYVTFEWHLGEIRILSKRKKLGKLRQNHLHEDFEVSKVIPHTKQPEYKLTRRTTRRKGWRKSRRLDILRLKHLKIQCGGEDVALFYGDLVTIEGIGVPVSFNHSDLASHEQRD